MKINNFEELLSRQKSRELVKIIYGFTKKDKFKKDFELTNQIKRASISILSNIAEGFHRQTDKEFKQFLYIARGSCAEVISQLYVALDQDYLNEDDFNKAKYLCIEISKMIGKFITYLTKQQKD